jgi:rod shape-determining protein MreD
MLASLVPQFVLATALPLVPPLGFLFFLAWRFVRPGLLPLWAGFPLGAFDDLFSGQPLGFAVLTWSLVMLALELIETRFPWRNFAQDWFTAGLIAIGYILMGATLSGALLSRELYFATGPQIVLSILAFPVVARIVARLDRFRMMRWRVVG